MKPIRIRRHAPQRRARSIAAVRALEPRTVLAAALWLAALLAIVAIHASSAAAATATERLVTERLGLSRFTLQTLRPVAAGRALTVPLELDGQRVTLSLEPWSFRSPDFRVLVPGPGGGLSEAPAPPSETWRGAVREWPGSMAAGSVHGGALRVAISLEDGRMFFVQPVGDAAPGAAPEAHVVYLAEDATASGTCATHEPAAVVDEAPPRKGGPSTLAALVADLAMDCDYELYVMNGSSVDATVLDVETVISAVNLVYDRDCGIQHRIVRVIVRTAEPDPYTTTSPDSLLNQFRNHWNASQTGIARDVAHLMTGKNIDGGVIGIASVGVVCNRTRAYGLSQTHFSSNASRRCALTAHELGHQWNAQHCDGVTPCNIMCSSINGCSGIGLPNFEPMGANAIHSFAVSRTCLDSPTTPVPTATSGGGVQLAASPTPFTHETRLSYFLNQSATTRLSIYDLSGRKIATLADGVEDPGWHARTWDGSGEHGHLRPGVYQARLEIADQVRTQKVILVE